MGDKTRKDRSEFHIRALMANASEGFIVVDQDARVRVLNETAEELLGVERSEAVGTDIGGIGCAGLAEAVRAQLEQTPPPGTSIVVTPGERVLTCKLVPFEQGDGAGMAVVLRDDTELIKQQDHAEAILAGAGDGLIVFTPDSRITYVNPAAVELLGPNIRSSVGECVRLADLLGVEIPNVEGARPCWEILGCGRIECAQFRDETDLRCWLRCGTPGEDGKPLVFRDKQERCVRCEVFQQNAPLLGELGTAGVAEVAITEPEHRVLEIRTNPVVDRMGRYLGGVSTLHDVTAAREIAVMKNEFVSMVSHELRTPLTSIKGYVDLIVDGDAGEINDIQREFLQIVQENSDRLVSLINDLLDISRIESGRVHLKIEPLDAGEIIENVMDTFGAVADTQKVTLNSHVARGLPSMAGDRDRTGQVLMNLVSNAIKYSPGGGSVTIEAKRQGGEVVLSVTDTGIGISDEDQRQLFTKFFRVDSSLTREIGGTGLGLSICKSVVELQGGRIWAKSMAGEGSTFSFTVPAAPEELVRTPPVSGPAKATGTVLVIDHDPEIADLVETYLRKRGYDVVKATSAVEARKRLEEMTPCLITLDVMLDDVDGFELLQQFKDDPRTAEVPIVVLSIVCDEGKSLRHGAADYLEKPIDQKRLMRIIDGLVGIKESPLAVIADDDKHIVDVLTRLLRNKGFAVAQAYNGRETMAAVERKLPDLILLDLKMPVMDGYQVIQEIKTHERTKDIPIVVMTAHRIDHKHIDLLNLTVGQVDKPFSAEDLAVRVEQILDQGVK